MKSVFLLCVILVGVWAQNDTATTAEGPIDRSTRGRNATIESPGPAEIPRSVGMPSAGRLKFVENRTDVTQRFYKTFGFGHANLWLNMTEVHVMYRHRYPFTNKSVDLNRTDSDVNSTSILPSGIEDLSSDKLNDLVSFFSSINASVLDFSGHQFFPIFSQSARAEDFRRSSRDLGSRSRRASRRTPPSFIHPSLRHLRERSSSPYMRMGRMWGDQSMWEQPQSLSRPTIEGYQSFASYKILLPLSKLGDLMTSLPKYNSTVMSVRLVPSRASKEIAQKQALAKAVDKALVKADTVFDSLGVRYQGLYDFRVMNSRIPYLPKIRVRDISRLPKIVAMKVPVYSRVLLVLSY